MKDCFGLHGHSAFGSVAKEKIGVGRKSATSVGHTTDPFNSLQAGKTVDISRCASESTDLLPPSALPRQQAYLLPGFSTPGLRTTPFQGDLAAFGSGSLRLPLPPALRRADYRCQSADADLTPVRLPNPCRLRRHPLPGEIAAIEATSPVIMLPLLSRVMLSVVVVFCDCPASASVVILYVAVVLILLYHIRRQVARSRISLLVLLPLGISRPLMIPAFGEILPLWNAKVSAGPPLSGSHYGLKRPRGARVGKRSAAVGKSACGLVTHLAGVIMLHEAGFAVVGERVNNVERYERQSRQKPPQTLIRLCPQPRGEMNGQAPSFDSPAVRCAAS